MNIIKDLWQAFSNFFTDEEISNSMERESKLKTVLLFDWNKLEDAYGKAINAPIHLEKLASEDKKVRQEGLDELSYTVYHQGSIYTSSVAAMSVLHEILQLEKPEEKQETFEMLSLLISGSSWHNSHKDLSIVSEEAKTEKWQNSIKEEFSWVEAIQKSADENVELYLSFLQNDLKENRLWTSHLLAYLQNSRDKIFPQIIAAIENEIDDEVKANLYITAECLTKKENADFFAKAVNYETDLLCKMLGLRTHLLLSHENPPKKEAEQLLNLLFQTNEKLISAYHKLPSASDFFETFTAPLIISKKVDFEQILKWYLKQAREKKMFSGDFAIGLFNAALGGVPEQTIDITKLTSLQKEAVILVAKQAFPKPNYNIGWIIDVLSYYKFPTNYEKMCEYIGEKL